MATDATSQQRTSEKVPRLHAGDRLTREEFERRCESMPEVKKAELVEGVVYMPSPVSAEDHGEPHFDFNGFLFTYRVQTPGVRGGDNSTLRLDLDNMPQPDGYLRIETECGGQTRMVEGFLEGGPELVVEVAASSASYDLHDKLNAYRRNGVQEYVVWRVWDRQIDWFELSHGRYQPLTADEQGVYRSRILPGLWLDAAAVINGNLSQAMSVLQQGMDSDEHREFVQGLRGAKQTE